MDKIEPPKKTGQDSLIEIAKAGVEALPGGSILSAVVQQVLQVPLDRRIDRFYSEVAAAINQMNKRIDALSSNDRFVSMLLQAAQIAARNHDNDKLEYLRNAVLNSVPDPSYDESLQMIFLHLIDRFTAWHVKILALIGNPEVFGVNPPIQREGAIKRILRVYDLQKNMSFVELILSDLESAMLVAHNWGLNQSDIEPGRIKITYIGQCFLDYIQAPPRLSPENRTP